MDSISSPTSRARYTESFHNAQLNNPILVSMVEKPHIPQNNREKKTQKNNHQKPLVVIDVGQS